VFHFDNKVPVVFYVSSVVNILLIWGIAALFSFPNWFTLVLLFSSALSDVLVYYFKLGYFKSGRRKIKTIWECLNYLALMAMVVMAVMVVNYSMLSMWVTAVTAVLLLAWTDFRYKRVKNLLNKTA